MSLVPVGGNSAPLTATAILARVSGQGTGLEADLVMARRPRQAHSSFISFPDSGAGIAASTLDPASVVARASLGA